MPLAFALVFFVSGAAALVFETLWFHRIGLLLGSSVWSTALVLTGFMAGLGLGNGLAARLGNRTERPARAYAILELVVGGAGAAVVLATPGISALLLPLLRAGLESPGLLGAVRLGTALALLLVPTTAMGATLPLLVAASGRGEPARFGETLGILYGANTAGAVAGALLGELVFLPRLGVSGAALAAAALNVLAALGALLLGRRAPPPRRPSTRPLDGPARLLLAAGLLSGGAMLALEVVWFRFLLLFVAGTSLAFALMLAVVLLGIGAGGLGAGRLLRREPGRAAHAPAVALLTGVLVALPYALLRFAVPREAYASAPAAVLGLAALLAFPAAAGSGVLFTFLGTALERRLDDDVRATGLFTLANTAGATLGSMLGGFVLLPRIGIEASVALLALAYGAVALAALAGVREAAPPSRRTLVAAGGAFAAALALFPFGSMEKVYLRIPAGRFERTEGSRVVAAREGLNETLLYLRKEAFGETLHHRLVTNGFSMSSTNSASTRYMKLFVWLPVALRPAPRDALLISFGVGMTAQALAATRSLELIDVVDLSPDVLEMRRVVFPDPASDPLRDPRVRVHVEDGRFFLQTTPHLYDLITAEPPPPKLAGVVNLYSLEYFALLRGRLRPGGIASYWLPVHNLSERESAAIVSAFCGAFPDCSLWRGERADWILLGSRDGLARPTEEAFSAAFRDAPVAREMARMGIERPESLCSLFLADADQLRALFGGAPPLTDDFPRRISSVLVTLEEPPLYRRLRETPRARDAFAGSRFVAATLPAALRERSLPEFEEAAVFDRAAEGTYALRPDLALEELHRILSTTPLAAPVVFLLTDPREVAAAERAAERGSGSARLEWVLGARDLGARDYASAAARFRAAAALAPESLVSRALAGYAFAMNGDPARASAELAALPPGDPAARWIAATLHVPLPAGTRETP